MLTLTYPMIGNYGVPDRKLRDEFGLAKGFESDQIHASALLVNVGTISYLLYEYLVFGGIIQYLLYCSYFILILMTPALPLIV